MGSRFTKINETFVCDQCGHQVPTAKKTCRNHCPKCLYSKHVDHFPGDRANECHGLLKPFAWEQDPQKGVVIWFRCVRCGTETRNRALLDDPTASDDFDAIMRLSGKSPG